MAVNNSPLLVVTLTTFCLTHMSSLGMVLPAEVHMVPHLFVSSWHPADLNLRAGLLSRICLLLSVVK